MPTPKKPAAARKPRAPRSRAEIADAFEEVSDEVRTSEAADPTTAEISRNRAAHVRSATSGLTPETVIQKLSGLGLDLQRSISTVQEQLVTEVTKLEETREAVALEAEELARLHKIDIAATNIGILVQDYENKNKTLEVEYQQKAADLAAQQAAAEKRAREEAQALTQQRARERDEYEYNKKVERARLEDEFQEKLRVLARENQLKQEMLQRGWDDREKNLAAKEGEFTSLKAQVENHPNVLKAEVDKQVAIATNSLKSTLTHQFEMQKKDLETNLRIAESRNTDQAKEIAALHAQIEKLQTQLEAANSKIETIAKASIDGAAKRDAFDHLVSVTKERENGSGRAKA